MTTILPLQTFPRIRGGLESVAGPLVGRDGQVVSENDWRRGVEVQTSISGETYVSGYGGGSWGSIENDDLKPVNEFEPGVEFNPVTIGAIFDCNMNGPQSPIGDIARQRAEAALERRFWSDLARLLYTGETYACGAIGNEDEDPIEDFYNPGLISLAQTPDGYDDGAPGSIRGVFQGLLDGVCDTWYTDPVFHVPRAWMPHFLGDVVRWDEAAGIFRFGPHQVSFDCYPNEGPDGTTTAVDGSEVWVYATTRPMAAQAESTEVLPVRDHRTNRYKVRAEREAIVAVDTSLVLAAKATVA